MIILSVRTVRSFTVSQGSNPGIIQMSRLMTKQTKWHVHPAKTQISLGICPSDQSFRCPHEESLGT